jgi:2-oxoglutarate dehydrogenase complex dihydrolipoamide succinyltransferase (E2) component
VSSSRTDNGAATLVEVTMPQMGVSVAEGTIVEWRKRPGDWIERDETICEITTDKIDTEIPSPASGRVVRILVEVNETVAVGTVLAELDAEAKPGEAHADEEIATRKSGDGKPASENGEPDRSNVISPVVQRIAAEYGVDVARVKGTGVGGRVRKKDLMAYIQAGHRQADDRVSEGMEAATPADSPAAEPTLHTESPYRPEVTPSAGARREPLSGMRKQIAEHMVRSRHTAAHCTTVIEVDMSRVVQRRAELKPAFAQRGVPLTYLAFVARATVDALNAQPILNASIDGDEIVYHDDVNLGIAVALDAGLIVPVIRQAQRLNLEGIAASIARLSSRARSNGLEPDDVQDGTFTITNPGQFGTVLATPIINQPQVAILDLEAIVKRPVVIQADRRQAADRVSEGPGDSVAIRPMTNLCLSFDHRALDGADAARFLAQIKARLEGWTTDE